MRTKTLRLHLGLLIAGALFPLALAPFSYWPIAIVSMTILFYNLHQQSAKQAFVRSAIYGLGMFGTGVSWVFVSMYVFGNVSVFLALLGTLIFCFFNAVFFALPFMLCGLTPKRPAISLVTLPALWVISEWVRSWLFTGFPWLYAGYSHTDTWLNGWAPIGGVLLLSFFTAFAANALAQIRLQKDTALPLTALSLVAALFLAGLALQKIDWTEPAQTSVSVALVQPNVAQHDKWSVSKRHQIMQNLLVQTEPHWGTDIIIWPEGAIPALYTQIPNFLEHIDQRALTSKTTLITGLPTNDKPEGPYYNSMLALGKSHGVYNKTRLVPFGEYVPLEKLIRGLNNFFDLPMSSFSLGSKNQPLLTAAGQSISTAICYEIAYPDLVAKNSRKSNILLTVSNDAWFGNTIAPDQHMQMARMRAIENAKPLMRGTNNGITALVDRRGKITTKLDQFTEGVITESVTPYTGDTPFTKYGSWPIVIFSLIIITVAILIILRNCSNGDLL